MPILDNKKIYLDLSGWRVLTFLASLIRKLYLLRYFPFIFDLLNVVGLTGIVYKDTFFLENKSSFHSSMI